LASPQDALEAFSGTGSAVLLQAAALDRLSETSRGSAALERTGLAIRYLTRPLCLSEWNDGSRRIVI